MKRWILLFALVGIASMLCLALIGCPKPVFYRTLDIFFAGGLPVAVYGHTAYCMVYDQVGGPPPAVPILGSNSVLLTGVGNPDIMMLDPSTLEYWQGEGGTMYNVLVWVDINGNYPTLDYPESGIDYQTSQVMDIAPSEDPLHANTYIVDSMILSP